MTLHYACPEVECQRCKGAQSFVKTCTCTDGRVPLDPDAERVIALNNESGMWRAYHTPPRRPDYTFLCEAATEPAALLAARCKLLGVEITSTERGFRYQFGRHSVGTYPTAQAALVAAWRAQHDG